MSMSAMTWARDQKVGAASTKLVLLLLADYADDDGHCWPFIETVAEKAEMSEKSVRRHLNKLEKIDLLRRRRKRRSDGTMGGYEYWLTINPPESEEVDVDEDTTAQNPPAGKMTAGGRKGRKARADARKSRGRGGDDQDAPGDETGTLERATTAQNRPPGRMTGGEGPNHRSSASAPPDICDRTTGHGDRSIEEPPVEPPVRPSSSSAPPPAGGRCAELEDFFGDLHRPALQILRGLKGWSPMVEASFLRRYVTGAVGELYLKQVPKEYHASILAECVYQFVELPEGQVEPVRWNGNRFQAWLRNSGTQARRLVAANTKADAQPGESAGPGVRLADGGLQLSDGRRLTARQAAAYLRVQAKVGAA